jgi:hypothetical protein
MGIFENANINPNTSFRFLRGFWRFFSVNSDTSKPLTGGFFFECDLFDSLVVRNLSMVHHRNIREFGQREYSLTVLPIELETRLHITEAAELLWGFPVETPNLVAVFLQL